MNFAFGVKIGVKKAPGVDNPSYATEGAAGADVRAHLSEEVTILPGETALIPTGLFLEIPSTHEVQVRPRSGNAFKHQVTVLNAPGTIDSDYRGEVKVLLINHGSKPFVVENKMRIAQLVVAPLSRAAFFKQEELSFSERGAGGFGHTGEL